jgi:Skp family chaperone for outer membrane proteins
MLKARKTWIPALAVALALCWIVGANANNLLRGRPTAVAVVDVQKAFDALAEKDQIEADLRAEAERLKLQEEDKKKSIRELQADLEILAQGQPAWKAKKEQLDTGLIELQVWRNFETQKLNRERGVQIENLYRKLTDSIGRVAGQQGYDVVLFKEKPVEFRGAEPQQIPTLIQVRKVLWSADDLDVTNAVITDMNNQFRSGTR